MRSNYLSLLIQLTATLALGVVDGTAFAAGSSVFPIPALPTYDQMLLPDETPVTMGNDGDLAWMSARTLPNSKPPCYEWEVVHQHWNPGTGAMSERPLSLPGQVVDQVALPTGNLFLFTTGCKDGDRPRIGFLSNKGEVTTAAVAGSVSDMPTRMLALSEDTAVIVTRDKATRHITAYALRVTSPVFGLIGRSLVSDRMPNLPVVFRNDFAVAVLDAERLMVLGGSNSDYRGCSPCRAETHILNIKTKVWQAGPMMLEARSEHDASRLPDGSVLVTGGYTADRNWGPGPSATAELWSPASNKFEAIAPMPTGTARHRAIWMPGQTGKTLLMVEGMSGSAPAFDVATKSWHNAATWYQGSEEGGCAFMPFVFKGNAYAWSRFRAEGHYSSKSCLEQKHGRLSILRSRADLPATSSPPLESLLVTYRSGAAFLPATDRYPALSIGGTTHAGMNSALMTGTVEAIGRDGRFRAMPTLLAARSEASAFRLGDGVLVVGGRSDGVYDRPKSARALQTEWLASAALGTKAQWVELKNAALSGHSAIAQQTDGSLLEVNFGSVSQLKLVKQGDSLGVERVSRPGLNRARRSTERSRVLVRQLPGGRLVVAGGEVQAEKVALLQADSNEPGSVDEYVGIGEFLPSRRHEILDPGSQRWRNSAPSKAAGGNVAILDDGRVMKIGVLPAEREKQPAHAFELSDGSGSSWSTLSADAAPKTTLNEKFRLFSVDGELFATGELPPIHTGGGPSGVEWFNSAAGRWQVIWQANAGDNWRDHVGRILVRTLIGTDGKVKTVVIPVGGL